MFVCVYLWGLFCGYWLGFAGFCKFVLACGVGFVGLIVGLAVFGSGLWLRFELVVSRLN